MPIIPKPNILDIWAEGGITTDPTPAKIEVGWIGGEVPPAEFENFMVNRDETFSNHVNQYGIAQWDALTDYQIGSLAIASDNQTYTSLIADNVGSDPVSSPFDWEISFISGLVITSNTTYMVPTDFPSLGAALVFLDGKTILSNVTVTIIIEAGVIVESSSVDLFHANSSRIVIRGEPPISKTITSVVSVVGASPAFSIEYVVNDTVDIAIGDFVGIHSTTGGTAIGAHKKQEGLWEVTNVTATNLTVTNTQRSSRLPPLVADLTGGSISKLPSVLEFTSASNLSMATSDGLQFYNIYVTESAGNGLTGNLMEIIGAEIIGPTDSFLFVNAIDALAGAYFMDKSRMKHGTVMVQGSSLNVLGFLASRSLMLLEKLIANGINGDPAVISQSQVAFSEIVACGNTGGFIAQPASFAQSVTGYFLSNEAQGLRINLLSGMFFAGASLFIDDNVSENITIGDNSLLIAGAAIVTNPVTNGVLIQGNSRWAGESSIVTGATGGNFDIDMEMSSSLQINGGTVGSGAVNRLLLGVLCGVEAIGATFNPVLTNPEKDNLTAKGSYIETV